MFWQRMKVHERIVLLRWVLPISIFLAVVVYQLLLFRWVHDEVGFVQHTSLEIVVYGIVGPIMLFLALSWVAQGIRQKEEAERLVHERDRFLANITHNAAEAIVSLDTNFRVRFWNDGARKLFGYEWQQMRGQHIDKLFVSKNRESEIEDLQNTLREHGILQEYETTLIQRNEEPISVELTITSMFNEADQLNGFSLIAHDIRLRKRREKMLTEERKRIAGEIHDSFAQDLYSVNLKLEVCQKLIAQDELDATNEEIELVRAIIKKGLRDVRRAIFALQPINLEEMGFESAVYHLLQQYEQLYQFRLHSEIELARAPIARRTQMLVFRTLQECLNNVAKHAHAQQAWISLNADDQQVLRLMVKDDGQGFLPDQVDTQAHLGLTHMKEQVARHGGLINVQTELGVGTSVCVTLPQRVSKEVANGSH